MGELAERRPLGTLVENGEVKRLSVSSVARYDVTQYGGCPRRWWYRHIAKRQEPQGAAAAAGERDHRCIERHLIHGEQLVGRARVAASLCAELRNEQIAIEQPLGGALVADGVPFEGRIDIVRWARGEVLDWKTTGKNRDELPSAPSLLHTVQMPGYGKWLLDAVQGTEQVRLTHAYLRAGWREPEVRSIVVDRDILEERWQEVEVVVRALRRDARAERAEDVPANDRACHAHGGCPHREVCSVGKGVTRMGLMDELKKGRKPGPTSAAQRIMNEAMLGQSPPSILPPDAPVSGERAPKAMPVPPEKLAELPPVVQEAVKAQSGVASAEEQPAKSKSRKKREEVQAKSPAEVTQDVVDAQRNMTESIAYEGAYTRCRVERVVNLGNYESARFELEMQLSRAVDPKVPLRDLTRELDDLAAEYVKARAVAR